MKLLFIASLAIMLSGCFSTPKVPTAKLDQLILDVPAELMKKPEQLKHIK
jgi:starvation-inducible outer membrane lipoprotein